MPIEYHHLFIESFSPNEGHVHAVKKVYCTKKTDYQQLEIVEVGAYGKALILDGKIQSSEVDEFIYHEAIVHSVLLAHPGPLRVLIIGGGEGATLREVLRHKTVEQAVMVDIDSEVVELSKQYLAEWHQGAYSDPRTELKITDARKYLENSSESFDAIIIDISEPVEEGPAYLLFTKQFYKIVHDHLTKNGVLSVQGGTISITDLECYSAISRTLRSVFRVVAPFYANVPSSGRPWGFIAASKGRDPRDIKEDEVDRLITERVTGNLGYYDGPTHVGSFILPKYIRKKLAAEKRIIEDDKPFLSYG